jgi:cytochrome P450 family 4 subfamily V
MTPLLCTVPQDLAKQVLGSGGPRQKSSLYQFLHPWLHTGLLTSFGEKWRTRRRL